MVVGVDERVAAPTAVQLARPVGDHLVGIHVGRGAGAGLEDVDDKLVVMIPGNHLLGSPDDDIGLLRVEDPQVPVDDRSSALDQTECPDESAPETQIRYREVVHRPLGGGPVVGIVGDLQLAHRITLDTHLSRVLRCSSPA